MDSPRSTQPLLQALLMAREAVLDRRPQGYTTARRLARFAGPRSKGDLAVALRRLM